MRKALRSEGMVAHPLKTRAPYLRGYEFAPDVVIDVGVARGTSWLYRCFPEAQFVLVDPQPGCAEAVRRKAVLAEFHFHTVAAGDKQGTAKLTLPYTDRGLDMALASTKLRVDDSDRGFKRLEHLEVETKPLDDIAVGYPGRVGLSIDTEGSELEVLIGAEKTLKRCDFVILKLPVTPRFDGAGVPSEPVSRLAVAGLEMRDVISMGAGHGKQARPRYLNMLFARWPA
jgi:FkbM family methyltransferase